MTFADRVIRFYKQLSTPPIPTGYEWLYPQQSPQVMAVVEKFFNKYYNDNDMRTLIFGINPGRFGAGTTGVNFTAPKQLTEYCQIEHDFKNQSELSAEFIYAMITEFGGPEKFYKKYFITSISPLGFIKNGKNINYYDDKQLLESVKPFIIECIQKQLYLPVNQDRCFCIGGDKNLKFFLQINKEYNFFKEIIPLPHPRFIMQYKRKQVQKFIAEYLFALK